MGSCAIRSERSFKAPLEFEDEEHVTVEDASSLVSSFEEHEPFEIIFESSSPMEDAEDAFLQSS